MAMPFKKKSEYANINQAEPTPEASSPTASTATITEPQTASEWSALSDKLLLKRRAAEKRQQEVTAEIQDLALRAQMGDEQAQQRIAEITQQALQLTQDVVTLHAAWMESNRKLTAAQNYETEAAKAVQREKFDQLLNRSLKLAEESDQHLSNYARVMADRQAVLMQAQGLANSNEERGRVQQLLNRQGPSWAMGFYGVPKFIEEANFMFARDFGPLSQFTKARLETWGVSTPEPAVASPAPVTKERVN